MKKINVLIAAGGTGGHLYPALAIARALAQDRRMQIIFVGDKKGKEKEIVLKEGFLFAGISAQGLKARKISRILLFIFALFLVSLEIFIMLARFRPSVIIGTGGYVSAPLLFIASLFNFPTLIHEQNVFPGRSNRILAKTVKKIAVSFAPAKGYFPSAKVLLTGNPVRSEILKRGKLPARKNLGLDADKKVVLVFGGSQGAKKINRALARSLKYLAGQNLQVLHISGEGDYRYLKKAFPSFYFLYSYMENMEDALASSDLVVCRAGATSIAEITARGIPALLIPYPFATDNHQKINAEYLEKKKAAKVILDEELSAERLSQEIIKMLRNETELKEMAVHSQALGKPEACENICKIIHQLAGIT